MGRQALAPTASIDDFSGLRHSDRSLDSFHRRRLGDPRTRDMYTFLLTLLILDAFVLAAAVLLQAGKGGGLAASFGGASSSADSLIGTRQAGNLLTKASWWCGGIFLGLAFILQMMSSRSAAPKSVLDKLAAPAAAPAAPSAPASGAAPASPLTQPAGQPAGQPTTPPQP
jgi:preprotein translocase subunit SecG